MFTLKSPKYAKYDPLPGERATTAYMVSENMHCWNFDHFKCVSKGRIPGLAEVNGSLVIDFSWTKASLAVFWQECLDLLGNFVQDRHFTGRTSTTEHWNWFKTLNNISWKLFFFRVFSFKFSEGRKWWNQRNFILKIHFSLTWNVWYFVFFLLPSPFLFINFSLHFPFFSNLKNKRKNKKEEVGGVGREEGRNDNYLGRDITSFHIPCLAFKVKTETSDTVSKIKNSIFSQNVLLCCF